MSTTALHPIARTSLFLARWLSAPARVGAVAPSSRKLSELMARAATPHNANSIIVELGGGTGAVTSALIDAVGIENVVVVEIDPAMCKVIERRFPGVAVVHGDAFRLGDALVKAGVGEPDAVASSLPLLNQPADRRAALVRAALEATDGTGVFVQYTYSALSPIPGQLLRPHGIRGVRVGHIWQNVPPASVWRFRKMQMPH